MATITCPNCGKPLRPGSRFCGNCGTTLPSSPRQAAAPAAEQSAAATCPHCGNPLRSSAKFCSVCGKAVETESHSAVTVAARSASTATGTSAEHARPPSPAPRPASAGAPPAPARKAAPAARSRKGVIFAAVIGFASICVVLAVGGYFGARQLGFIGKKTAVASVAQGTATLPVPHATTALVPAVPATATPPVQMPSPGAVLMPSPTLPAASPTLPLPTLSPQPSVVVETVPSTVEVLPTATFTVALTQASEAFIDDTFADESWRRHWLAWGDPIPLPRSGGGGSWLSLTAVDVPGDAGITSKAEYPIPNAPGVEVEFDATLDRNSLGSVFLFDWDPKSNKRDPDNSLAGVIHLEIRRQRLLLTVSGSSTKCEVEVDALQKRTYLLRLLPGQGVELYLDQADTPLCPALVMGMEPRPGSVSFSGRGDLTRVRVSVPPVP